MLTAVVRLALAKDEVIAMREKKMTLEEIAYHYDTWPQIVSRMLAQWRVENKTKRPKTERSPSGGVAKLVRDIESGEVALLRERGASLSDIAKSYQVSVSTVHLEITRAMEKLGSSAAVRLQRGKTYGSMTFEGIITGKTRLFKFRHRRGWVETFTEQQLRETEEMLA